MLGLDDRTTHALIIIHVTRRGIACFTCHAHRTLRDRLTRLTASPSPSQRIQHHKYPSTLICLQGTRALTMQVLLSRAPVSERTHLHAAAIPGAVQSSVRFSMAECHPMNSWPSRCATSDYHRSACQCACQVCASPDSYPERKTVELHTHKR